MSPEYSRLLLKEYLKDTPQIKTFLSNPINNNYLEIYAAMVNEFQHKIIAHKKDYQSFDHIMNHLHDLLISRDETLRKHWRLTRLMLFYMYWNCDIGVTEEC